MDIKFHYYIVKVLCRLAEFEEKDAQLIAQYSQFVDDYSVWRQYYFKVVPAYAQELVKKTENGFSEFYTVTTGFETVADNVRVTADTYQKEVIVPFHFMPPHPLREYEGYFNAKNSQPLYRTVPGKLDENMTITRLLNFAKAEFKAAGSDPKKRRYSLMRIGILLHIFADTYAHQEFSGFKSWMNNCQLESVVRADDGKDITSEFSPQVYSIMPPIGHAEVNTVPDQPYVGWEMKQAANENETSSSTYSKKYQRKNHAEFVEASIQILNYLISCQNDAVPYAEDEVRIKLLAAMLAASSKNIEDFKRELLLTFPNTEFKYCKEELWQQQLVSLKVKRDDVHFETAKDDFFHYNILAKEIRDEVIG